MNLTSFFRRRGKGPADTAPAAPAEPQGPARFGDDIFLVSYPKSGNTWLRFLVGNYLSEEPVTFTSLHTIMPDLYVPESMSLPVARPRFIKSHSAFDAGYPRTVYIVRDGRDATVSAFFHQKKLRMIDENTTFSEFLPAFSASGFPEYGNWSDHVGSWLDHADSGAVAWFKYEDMLEAPARVLAAVIEFSGLDADPRKVERAVERSSFKSMQAIEAREHDEYFGKIGQVRSDIPFVREGKKGGWREYFSEADLAVFNQRHGTMQERLGY